MTDQNSWTIEEVACARRDTPHVDERIFFTSAGCAPVPRPVLDRQAHFLECEQRYGGYRARDELKAEIDQVYDRIALLHGVASTEVAILDNASRAWSLIVYSIPFSTGDEIITCETEYHSNFLSFLHLRDTRGVRIVVAPSLPSGELDVSRLESVLSKRTRLIALSHVPTNSGLVQPVSEIGAFARKHGLPFLLDACQSVGQMPVDATAIGCSALVASGRKFLRAPRGTGYLWIDPSFQSSLSPAMIEGQSADWIDASSYVVRTDARCFETWEKNYAAVVGLGAAVGYAERWGLPKIAARVEELAQSLRSHLREVDGVTVCDQGSRQCGIVSFTIRGLSAEDAFRAYREKGIELGYSGRGSTLLDMERRGLAAIVRASIHYFNTTEEIARMAEVTRQLSAGHC
jgi:selenocysteine lyase/cysteine desulfurase